jgi:hypothetical protein
MSERKPDLDYERSDADASRVTGAGAVIAGVSVIACVVVLVLFNLLSDRARRQDPANPPLARHEQGRTPPEPRLQVLPLKDIGELRAEEQAVLHGAAWVDQKAGIAQIPIEEAMKIVAEQGLPRWPPVPSPLPSPAPARPATKGAAP